MTWLNGRVETRVWANRGPAGVELRIDQVRLFMREGETGSTHSLAANDLKSALRGLYQASVWLRQQQGTTLLGRIFRR